LRSRRIPERGHCGAGDREGESAFQKKGGKIIEKRYGVGRVINRRAGSWEGTEGGEGTKKRERERERKDREGIDDSEGGTHVPIEGGVRVGGVGERKLDWERSSERFEFPWEKRGGAQVHGRYQGAGHRWPEPRQKRKTDSMAGKRRSVTVTECYGLNRKR